MATEYPIRTIADFLAVSPESIDACLADFKQWLAFARDSAVLIAQMDEALGISESTFLADRFTWIDDGVSGLRYVDYVNPEETQRVRVEIPTA